MYKLLKFIKKQDFSLENPCESKDILCYEISIISIKV